MYDHNLASEMGFTTTASPTSRGAPIHRCVVVHFVVLVGLPFTNANYGGVGFIFVGSGPVAVLFDHAALEAVYRCSTASLARALAN